MAELHNLISNNESVNFNADNHGSIAQDTDDADNMKFSGDKESTITDSGLSSS